MNVSLGSLVSVLPVLYTFSFILCQVSRTKTDNTDNTDKPKFLLMLYKVFEKISFFQKKKFCYSVQEFEAKLKEIKKSEEGDPNVKV